MFMAFLLSTAWKVDNGSLITSPSCVEGAAQSTPLNHIMGFASCFQALEESGSVDAGITGLTTEQLPLKSPNVPHIRYANTIDEYKNQQNILVATVSK